MQARTIHLRSRYFLCRWRAGSWK